MNKSALFPGRLVGLLLALLLTLQAAVPLQARASAVNDPARPSLQDPAELEAFIDGLLASQMATNHIPGAVVAVVKDGSLFFSKGYGFADLENRIPVDPEQTLFRPGSVSKLFTWTAVMQLVEQGKLSLDADVNTYLDFTIPSTYPEPVTLRNLLTHTPGFEDKGQGLFVLDPQALPNLETYLKGNLPERVFPPGKLGAYSNYGAALAGYIIQRTAGMPFEEYVERNIFDPLGMEHSTFRQPLPGELSGGMAQGYNYYGGTYVKGGFEYVSGAPAGALSATAADMARFMIAHLQDGQYNDAQILSKETTQQMHSRLFTADPRLDGMAYGFFESTINGKRIISHGGDTLLFHSGLFLILDENVGVYVSTNGVGGASTGSTLMAAFMDRYYPVPDPAPLTPPAGFANEIAPYAGQYTLARSSFTTLEKILSLLTSGQVSATPEGYLNVSLLGQKRQFVEVEPGLLQDREDPDIRLVYQTDSDGQRYILPPEPFAYIKTPWYGTLGLQALLLVLGMLLFLGALIGWPIAALARIRRKESISNGPRLARWVGGLFALVAWVFLIGFAGLFAAIDPAYGVPGVFFSTPPAMNFVMSLPLVLGVLSLVMLAFTVIAWARGYWHTGGRIFYSLLTVAALAFLWQLTYWNLLL